MKALVLAVSCAGLAFPQTQKLYNTTRQKLLEGRQVFSFTQSKFDIAAYCEARSTTTSHGLRCSTRRSRSATWRR